MKHSTADKNTEYFVDVRDTARLHVAGVIDPDIKNERIFAFSETYTWNQILGILRKLRPKHKLVEDIADNSEDLSTVVPKPRAEAILKKNFGQAQFIGLEASLKENIAHLE